MSCMRRIPDPQELLKLPGALAQELREGSRQQPVTCVLLLTIQLVAGSVQMSEVPLGGPRNGQRSSEVIIPHSD